MKKILILIAIITFCGELSANCDYKGSAQIQTLSLSPKVSTNPAVPIGGVLYMRKFGTGAYKTFECSKGAGDQYIVTSTGQEVPGVKGLLGKPVYETGIDGIGFQVSDLLESSNGSLIPAVVGSTVVPVEDSARNQYRYITVWLIKTKEQIDSSGISFNPKIVFSAGTTNPSGVLYTGNINLGGISFSDTSCDISVAGPSTVKLKRIEKSELGSVSRGGVTSAQTNISMNISCPSGSVGNNVSYWFNPIGGRSASGDGIIDNMLTGATAAANVGIIFKKDSRPITFYDNTSYQIRNVKSSETVNITADYYRATNVKSDIGTGNVKAMLEVIVQED